MNKKNGYSHTYIWLIFVILSTVVIGGGMLWTVSIANAPGVMKIIPTAIPTEIIYSTPIPSVQNTPGTFCGGIAGLPCPTGFECRLDGTYPDAGGTCKQQTAKNSPDSTCRQNNGTWRAEYRECEGLDKDVCESSGGIFDECASACRHSPKDTMCIMMCIPVCTYP